jgi:hypothetical protein
MKKIINYFSNVKDFSVQSGIPNTPVRIANDTLKLG